MAQQTHAQIVDAIATILRTNIRSLAIVYGSANLTVNLTAFPAAMILLGPDDYSRMGVCEYWIRVFVAPVATGNPTRAYQDCLSLSTTFHDVFSGMASTVGDRFIDRSKITTKMGFGNSGFGYTLKWGRAEHYGFQINLPLVPSIPGN